MMLSDAIARACADVGVVPPKGAVAMRRWIPADTLAKNGKGDGRLICDEDRVTAVNWQTGDKATVWLKDQFTPADKKRFAERRAKDARADREKAARAASIASKIIGASKPGHHPYLTAKGFPDETAPVIAAEKVRELVGDYIVPEGAKSALVVPARIGSAITSVQLIWSDGTKKFLYGGEMGRAAHKIATGADTWLCEGFATGLSIRAALRGSSRRDTILVCFSAANIAKVAKTIKGRCYIAADCDAPPAAKPEQFNGLGAGEFFARQAGRPYTMPPVVGTDFNDLHQSEGIFAVQRVLSRLIREAGM
ncbi:toprim domain-containing protein [Pelagibacterium sp.]|uniref:toprim domain-containing protein n=1 Tax=Pelagibacterium sp. TaxID=1967288 RepID=UPI003A8E9DCA